MAHQRPMAKQNANAMSAFVRTRHEPAVGKAERQAEIPEVGCALEGSGTDCHKEMPPSGSESIVSRGKPRSASVPEKLTFAAQATGLSPAGAIFVCQPSPGAKTGWTAAAGCRCAGRRRSLAALLRERRDLRPAEAAFPKHFRAERIS